MGGFLSGVSAPELLAALAIPAGAALAYHGGRYTGPIGAGLAGFGGLGLALGQRQYNQQQQAQLAQQTGSLAKIFTGTPQEKDANQFFNSPGVQQMGPTEAWKAWDERQNPKGQKGQWFKTPQGGFEFIEDVGSNVIPPAGAMLNGKPALHAGDIPYEKAPNQGMHVPNALDARAMQIGGTTDISQLATHPQWIAQAQNEQKQYDAQQKLADYEQQRRIALATRPPPAPESMVPFSPADVTTDTSHISPTNPKGEGVMFRGSKSGKLAWTDTPGMTPKADQPPRPPKPLTPVQRLATVAAARKAVDQDWADLSLKEKGGGSYVSGVMGSNENAFKKQGLKQRMFFQGLDVNGQPLPEGAILTDVDGKTPVMMGGSPVTWKNP